MLLTVSGSNNFSVPSFTKIHKSWEEEVAMYVLFRAEYNTLKYILKQNKQKHTKILWNSVA